MTTDPARTPHFVRPAAYVMTHIAHISISHCLCEALQNHMTLPQSGFAALVCMSDWNWCQMLLWCRKTGCHVSPNKLYHTIPSACSDSICGEVATLITMHITVHITMHMTEYNTMHILMHCSKHSVTL